MDSLGNPALILFGACPGTPKSTKKDDWLRVLEPQEIIRILYTYTSLGFAEWFLLFIHHCLSTIYPLLFIHHLLPIGSSTIWDLVGSLRWLADRRRAPELRNSHPGPGPANDESSTVKEPRISRIFGGFTISWVFHGVPKLLKPANIMKLAKNWGNCYQILSFWVWPSLFLRTSIVFLGRLDCQAASKAVSSSSLAEKPKSWRWRAGLIPY